MRAIRIQPGRSRNTLTISFSYDEELVALIKQVPGRTWDKDYKTWSIPDTPENLAWLRARVPANVELRIDEGIVQTAAARTAAIATAQKVRDAGDSEIAHDYVTAPYAHQRAGLEFLTHIESGALLWEMGLGKTKTVIDYAEWLAGSGELEEYRQAARGIRVLVICPNTVKNSVWAAEIPKHAGHHDFIVPAGTLAQRATQIAQSTARYTIVNCEALSYASLAGTLKAIDWDLVVVDESTRFKSPKAQRTKVLHKLRAARRVILTGTPITNTAEDAWAQYHFVTPGLLGTWWSFQDRYLQKDWFGNVVGIKKGMAQDLAARMDSRSYRILKSQVLDLPPKVYVDRVVQLAGDQQKAYNQMRDELRVQLAGKSIDAFNILTQLLRLTQITAGLVGESGTYQWLSDKAAKVVELDALLREELRHEQVVVFGVYQRELEELAKRYAGILGGAAYVDGTIIAPIIYGPTPERVRAELINQFQEGQRRILFAQIRTGGIGINLTAAQNAVYHTRGWSLEEYLQSQDRLHRIGQTGTVNIVHLIAEGTVDEQIAKALASKQNLADVLTGDAVRRLAKDVLGD